MDSGPCVPAKQLPVPQVEKGRGAIRVGTLRHHYCESRRDLCGLFYTQSRIETPALAKNLSRPRETCLVGGFVPVTNGELSIPFGR